MECIEKKIQQILDKIDNKTYLKIGVNRGDNFTKINAKRKVGVNPLPPSKKVIQSLNKDTTYHQMLSVVFFHTQATRFSLIPE